MLDLDPMKMDRITAFFLSILYAYKQETESATKCAPPWTGWAASGGAAQAVASVGESG